MFGSHYKEFEKIQKMTDEIIKKANLHACLKCQIEESGDSKWMLYCSKFVEELFLHGSMMIKQIENYLI